MQNRMFFVLLRPIFCEKLKIAPPHAKRAPPETFELVKFWKNNRLEFWRRPFFFFFFFFFYWRSLDFGRKKRLNFGFRPKNHSEFWRRPFFFFFFWRSPNFWRKNRLNFRSFRDISSQILTNRLRLI